MSALTETKKVSVIVPVYKAGRWLDRCASSILGQTHRNLELIMVDDGSPDDSGSRVDACTFTDARARGLHIPHSGVSAARNAGMDIATGDYLLFVDADDELHPQAVELMVHTALKTGADIISAPIRGNSTLIFKRIDIEQCGVRYYLPEAATELHLYRKKVDCSVCGKLFERKLFTENDIRFPEGLRYEDIAVSHQTYSACRGVAHLDKRVYFYRIHSDGFLRTWSADRRDCFPVVEKILKETEGNPRLHRAAEDRMFFISFNIFLLARQNGEGALARKCWEGVKKYRLQTLVNRRTVAYNRWRALASYLGPRIASRITIYKY